MEPLIKHVGTIKVPILAMLYLFVSFGTILGRGEKDVQVLPIKIYPACNDNPWLAAKGFPCWQRLASIEITRFRFRWQPTIRCEHIHDLRQPGIQAAQQFVSWQAHLLTDFFQRFIPDSFLKFTVVDG